MEGEEKKLGNHREEEEKEEGKVMKHTEEVKEEEEEVNDKDRRMMRYINLRSRR